MADSLRQQYLDTRSQSLAFCAPLEVEDYGLQAAAFASPPKWHLAHTTWFFETFILKVFAPAYSTPEPLYEQLFNSYYNGIGEQFPRPDRGLLSRPTVAEVLAYRSHVDAAVLDLLDSGRCADEVESRLVLGIEHERQHQELFFTDIKYSLGVNPLLPTFLERDFPGGGGAPPVCWYPHPGGLLETGFAGEGFCFDNELPRHRTYLEPFELASRLVSNAEYAEFVEDGGYRRPELWLSDGWAQLQAGAWQAPPYWLQRSGEPMEYTLHGLQPRQPDLPVCHVSGYEAEAYARWAGARLPTEQEWEAVAAQQPGALEGVDGGLYHPAPAAPSGDMQQLYGHCWQWTRSAYVPYPGYSPSPGAIGEYNGKFMSNQWVLRGGSCVSKAAQVRPSYRNFFYPQDRWQFSGIRLARSGARNN